jgi:hypothetical protein
MGTQGVKLSPRRVDLVGQRFGLLVVTAFVEVVKHGHTVWECVCDCGETHRARAGMLKRGNVRSCGCFRRGPNWNRSGNKTHGQTFLKTEDGRRAVTPLYATWSSMIQRCTNPKAKNYKWYGARGVTICERWMTFANFAEDMGPERPDGLSLDRIDNDLLVDSYSKENCRWATQSMQVRNSRRPQRLAMAGA